MDDLIEALTILRKYGNPKYPTHCEHAILTICDIDPAGVSDDDKKRLDELGFHVSDQWGEAQFVSYKFGGA